MFFPVNIITFLIVLALFTAAEFFLTKRMWQLGLIFPILSLIAAIFIDNFLFIPTLILFAAFICGVLANNKRKELEKTKIQDLE